MTCQRASEIDPAAYLVEPDAPEWQEFREHFPYCEECAAAVADWTQLEVALLDEPSEEQAWHPEAELLVQFEGDPKSLTPDRWQRVDGHLNDCRSCADQLAVLREFDFSVIEEASARGVRGRLRAVVKSIRGVGRRGAEGATAREPQGLLGPLSPRGREPALVLQSAEVRGEPDAGTPTIVGVLHVIRGPRAGDTFRLVEGESRLGRGAECEIRISGPDLARTEATLSASTSGVAIASRNRRRPVLVNDEPVDSSPVRDGDVLSLGDVSIRFEKLTTNVQGSSER